MKTKKLGINGPVISEIGLGCMGMSDFYGSKSERNDNESISTIHEALNSGITLIDTGDYYGSGHNELLINKALKGRTEKPLICVKFGGLRTPQGGFTGVDARPEAVKNFAAYSLVRLGVEVIDIYQPGRINPAIPIEDTVGAIADLVKEGYVRYIGLSEANSHQLRKAHSIHPITMIQVEYSLATRVLEKELLKTARELGVGITGYGVLSRGLLTDSLNSDFSQSDFRAHAPRFTGENFKKNLEKVNLLRKFAQEKGCTTSQLAIAWACNKGDDIIPLIGASKVKTLKENLGAPEVILTKEEMDKLDNDFPEGSFSGERYDEHQMKIVVN